MKIKSLFYGMFFSLFATNLILLATGSSEDWLFYKDENSETEYVGLSKLPKLYKSDLTSFSSFQTRYMDMKTFIARLFIKDESESDDFDEDDVYKTQYILANLRDDLFSRRTYASILKLVDASTIWGFYSMDFETGMAIYYNSKTKKYRKNISVLIPLHKLMSDGSKEQFTKDDSSTVNKLYYYNLATKEMLTFDHDNHDNNKLIRQREQKVPSHSPIIEEPAPSKFPKEAQWAGVAALIAAGGYGVYRLWNWVFTKPVVKPSRLLSEAQRAQRAR